MLLNHRIKINNYSHVRLCCELCNNDDKNRKIKIRTQYTDFMWFVGVFIFTKMMDQNFIITEIRLYKRVFIITLNMIKLQKYSYTMDIPYHGGFTPVPSTYYITPIKRICLKGSAVILLQHLPSFTHNMSHMPLRIPNLIQIS